MIKSFSLPSLDTSSFDLTGTAHHVVMGMTLLANSIQWLSFQKSKLRSFLILRHPFDITVTLKSFLPCRPDLNALGVAFQHACSSSSHLECGLEKRHMGLHEVIKPGLKNPQLLIKTLFFINVPF